MLSSHFGVIWQKVSENNRIYFWSIFTTGVVGFFSLWLGITIQDDINTKNARETQKLARYQMVQAVYPSFSRYIDTSGSVFFDLWEMYNAPVNSNKEDIKKQVFNYYTNNQEAFVETMINSVNFMCDNRYFFNKFTQKRICSNNVSILFGLSLLERNNKFLSFVLENWIHSESLRDSLSVRLLTAHYAKNVFSYQEEVVDDVMQRCRTLLKTRYFADSTVVVENTLYSLVFLSYMDNFLAYQSELIPGDDVHSHLGRHVLILLLCILFSSCFCIFLLYHVFRIHKLKDETDNNPPTI